MSKLRELEQRLRDEPHNLGLRVTVAGALREAGRQAEAVELYRSVAVAYRDQGRRQQAIAVCRSILEIAPDDQGCHALLGTLLGEPGQAGRAPTGSMPGHGVVPALGADDLEIEVGTPAPPTQTAAGSAVDPAVPRAIAAPGVPLPRRSSYDETPLPRPLPYHVADPTTRSLKKLSDLDLGEPVAEGATTRPGSEDGALPQVQGIANAARRITAQLSGARPSGLTEDLAAEVATRRHRRLDSEELELISRPPPTPDPDDDDDNAVTHPPYAARGLRGDPLELVDRDDDDGIPTLPDEADDHDEVTRPRDYPLDVMLRAEAHGPLASPFFAPLPEEHRGPVFARFRRKDVAPGAVVIRQGEVGHPLVLVERGQLEIRVERARGPVWQLGPVVSGEHVGEAALLARTPSPVQVVAVAPSTLLLLAPRDFYEIAGAFPALWAQLKDVAQRRTRELDARTKR